MNTVVPNESAKPPCAGFEGEISGLGLAEIIQLNALNRFSGCIEVNNGDRRGHIFLRDGAIVHAEQGDKTGEIAFYEIVSWPGGRFSLQENVATTCSTIKKTCQFLILEAHRLIDERRAGRRGEPAARASSPAAAKPASAAALLDRMRAIPGVASVVVQGKAGGRIGDESYGAEVLGGQALYLAMVARQLGERLQAGELLSAVAHGTTGHLLLFALKNHYVAVLAQAEAQVGVVESEVRKVLSAAR